MLCCKMWMIIKPTKQNWKFNLFIIKKINNNNNHNFNFICKGLAKAHALETQTGDVFSVETVRGSHYHEPLNDTQ